MTVTRDTVRAAAKLTAPTITKAVADLSRREVKPAGWCEDQGISHAWEVGPTLTSDPPIQTRSCKNCGKVQWLRAPVWEDR